MKNPFEKIITDSLVKLFTPVIQSAADTAIGRYERTVVASAPVAPPVPEGVVVVPAHTRAKPTPKPTVMDVKRSNMLNALSVKRQMIEAGELPNGRGWEHKHREKVGPGRGWRFSKITADDVCDIQRVAHDDDRPRDWAIKTASQYGLNVSTVRKIGRGETWKHVKCAEVTNA